MPAPIQLPDDIEQRLRDGQRWQGTRDLMARRRITLGEAQTLVARWLYENLATPNPSKSANTRSSEEPTSRLFSRRRTDQRPEDN